MPILTNEVVADLWSWKKNKQEATTDLATIIKQVMQRDHEDRNRKIAPLKQAKDAILIDTTHLSIEQVVEKIMNIINSDPTNS